MLVKYRALTITVGALIFFGNFDIILTSFY
nr:MAG TPA: hypothetical protein [Caudoviricetes sp.]